MSNSTRMPYTASLLQRRALPIMLSAAMLFTASLVATAQFKAPDAPATPLGIPMQLNTNLNTSAAAGNIPLDGTVVAFDVSYSNAIDNLDGRKAWHATAENWGMLRNGVGLVLEARKPVVVTDTIFYRMNNLKFQDYQLEFYPLNMAKPGLTAVLVDKFLLTRTPINLLAGPTYYPFTINASCGCAAVDRFMLIFTQADSGPLPVTFVSVSASQNNSGVQVNWKVAGERGIREYVVQRSKDGLHFENVGTVAATGYSDNDKSYSFTDGVQNGTRYYRILSVEIGGVTKFSAVVKASNGSTAKTSIVVSPNPVPGSTLNLQLTNAGKGRHDIELRNTDGRVLMSTYRQHSGASDVFQLDIPTGVSRGTYILSVTGPDQVKRTQLVVISR